MRNHAVDDGPFAVVNCAAMHPDRMETELFGIEGGTEAGRKVGMFERADKGTLLLDEIGDMPLETQGKIIRVLQEQNFERVGGTSQVQVDVRVIASTTKDLTSEINARNLREDLYYRLNVVPIHVPSLIDRRDDIPVLARHFMTNAAGASRASRTRIFGRCVGRTSDIWLARECPRTSQCRRAPFNYGSR